ncbi:hypothetical protein RRG08_046981 [Elysia crispata]|uniref:Uncharacterized protein n=1 Tax=Elysia crispata TaxID=231223 RepID=A0AAE1A8X3_9GAST|nr:hypothetical protein RRG08_046981 [Elysia crispata]
MFTAPTAACSGRTVEERLLADAWRTAHARLPDCQQTLSDRPNIAWRLELRLNLETADGCSPHYPQIMEGIKNRKLALCAPSSALLPVSSESEGHFAGARLSPWESLYVYTNGRLLGLATDACNID